MIKRTLFMCAAAAIAVGILAAAPLALGCGASKLEPLDQVHVAEENVDDVSCLALLDDAGHRTTAEQACRADVRAKWDAYWSRVFADGGAK